MKFSIGNEIFIPGPSLAAEKQGLGLKYSIENEIFKPRMKTPSENENLVRGGMVFFMRSSENEFFSIPGPSGKRPKKGSTKSTPIVFALFRLFSFSTVFAPFRSFWDVPWSPFPCFFPKKHGLAPKKRSFSALLPFSALFLALKRLCSPVLELSTHAFSSKLRFFEPPIAFVETEKAWVELTPEKHRKRKKSTERGIRVCFWPFLAVRFRTFSYDSPAAIWQVPFRFPWPTVGFSGVFLWLRVLFNPKGPKIEKIKNRPPGLKFSIEIEIFKRATRRPPNFLWGILKVRHWKFQSRLIFSIEIENFNRDWFFQSLGP